MALIDKHYLEHPYKGGRRMYVYLKKDMAYSVSLNRINRLYYKVMGLRAIFPGPHTSKRGKNHRIYPYLLRGLAITYPNQVWSTDITYIPIPNGYTYLMAIIDLFSRYVIHWSLSNTMDANWCATNFLEAIENKVRPEIINTDQGSQFTSNEFTEPVIGNEVKLSMDDEGMFSLQKRRCPVDIEMSEPQSGWVAAERRIMLSLKAFGSWSNMSMFICTHIQKYRYYTRVYETIFTSIIQAEGTAQLGINIQ